MTARRWLSQWLLAGLLAAGLTTAVFEGLVWLVWEVVP